MTLAGHLSPEDLRLRFFAPVRRLTHALAARLTQIDYDREMALLALHGGVNAGRRAFLCRPGPAARRIRDRGAHRLEGPRDGYLLMSRLIDIARQCGIGELVGEVLPENGPMLQMCRALGFTVAPDPEDPAVLRVQRSLASE